MGLSHDAGAVTPISLRTANVERFVRSAAKCRILHEFAAPNSSIRRLAVEPTAQAISPCERTAAANLECQVAEHITEHVTRSIHELIEHRRISIIVRTPVTRCRRTNRGKPAETPSRQGRFLSPPRCARGGRRAQWPRQYAAVDPGCRPAHRRFPGAVLRSRAPNCVSARPSGGPTS